MLTRPLEKQFEPEKVAEIRALIDGYQALRLELHGGLGGYLISGISRSLETGILLGALSLSFSLLEMFVHDLVIRQDQEKMQDDNHDHETVLKLFPGHEPLPFENYIAEFVGRGLIKQEEGDLILGIYKQTAIPLHHSLSRRIGRFSRTLLIGQENLLDRFLSHNFAEVHHFEDVIEDHAIESMNVILSFISKYHNAHSEPLHEPEETDAEETTNA
ncbi:MAG: hypothetical protein R3231_11905 [bacterium]|nr:hypothetical protein [bacterium]